MKLIIILSIICTILSYLLGYYIGRVTYIPNKINVKEMRYLLILCLLLSGCQTLPKTINVQSKAVQKPFVQISPSSYLKIYYSKDDIYINAIRIEIGITLSEAIVLWDNYKKSDYSSFFKYLIEVNPFSKVDRIYIEVMSRVKAQTKILLRSYAKK